MRPVFILYFIVGSIGQRMRGGNGVDNSVLYTALQFVPTPV